MKILIGCCRLNLYPVLRFLSISHNKFRISRFVHLCHALHGTLILLKGLLFGTNLFIYPHPSPPLQKSGGLTGFGLLNINMLNHLLYPPLFKGKGEGFTP